MIIHYSGLKTSDYWLIYSTTDKAMLYYLFFCYQNKSHLLDIFLTEKADFKLVEYFNVDYLLTIAL